MKFDSFGDMQRHILVEHIQKGEWLYKGYACHDINNLHYLPELYESL
jgi:hypothetical protein